MLSLMELEFIKSLEIYIHLKYITEFSLSVKDLWWVLFLKTFFSQNINKEKKKNFITESLF